MRMSEQMFRSESAYAVTMSHVLIMLRKGIITQEEYRMMNEWMREKYQPASDGLIFESGLLSGERRANMPAGKEA